jgi:hypothetical protein
MMPEASIEDVADRLRSRRAGELGIFVPPHRLYELLASPRLH